MLELVDLVKFEVVVAPKLGVAFSHGVGGFQQVAAKETVVGLDEVAVLGLVVAGLVLCPNKAGILGNGRSGLKTVNGPMSILGHKKLKVYADFSNSSSSFCCGVI